MKYLLLVLSIVCGAGQLVAEEITTRDFAAGYYLTTTGNNGVYSLELPEDVYHTVKSGDLKDVRVFNSAGEVVPHDFRIVRGDPTTLREETTIPFFPLFQEMTSVNNQAGISLQVARDQTGAIVNIKSDLHQGLGEREITGYLLDLSHVKKEVSELLFSWHKDIDSSVFTLNIFESNDLEHWTTLMHRATLADLQFAGQQVQRRTVELPKLPMKYLKLTWQESGWPLKLTTVTGFSKVLDARRKYHWVSLHNGVVQEKDDLLLVDFTTDYRLPTGSVQIHFPQTNAVALLSVESRPAAEKAWRPRCQQVFFDFSFDGSAIRNEPCRFSPTADSQWRAVVRQDGAGLHSGKGALSLQLGWQPSELLFIGRGSPPYLLAFGSGKLARQQEHPGTGMLLQFISDNPAKKAIRPAQIGKKIQLSGESALQDPAQPRPWKKWLLWAVLVLGVGLLAFMASRLIKEMQRSDEKRVAGK